jgi:hypothetical protein
MVAELNMIDESSDFLPDWEFDPPSCKHMDNFSSYDNSYHITELEQDLFGCASWDGAFFRAQARPLQDFVVVFRYMQKLIRRVNLRPFPIERLYMEGMDCNVLHMYSTLFRVDGVTGYLHEYELARSFARHFSFHSLPHILWHELASLHQDFTQYTIPAYPYITFHSSFTSTISADADPDQENVELYEPYPGSPADFHIGHLLVLPKYVQFAQNIRTLVQSYSLPEFVPYIFCRNCLFFETHDHVCFCRFCHSNHPYSEECVPMCSICSTRHPPDAPCQFSTLVPEP